VTKQRADRLQQIVDAVEDQHDQKPSDVTLTWGEIRELLSLRDERGSWAKACIGWRAWVETLAVRLGISKPEKMSAEELRTAVAREATYHE